VYSRARVFLAKRCNARCGGGEERVRGEKIEDLPTIVGDEPAAGSARRRHEVRTLNKARALSEINKVEDSHGPARLFSQIPMSVGAGTKRKRSTRAVYHNTVSHDGGYGTVVEKPLGLPLLSSLTTRTENDTWATATSWGLPDDLLFALDPNGELYDTAVDADVMEEVIVQGDKSTKKSKVSVSYLSLPPNQVKLITVSQRRLHVVWMEVHREEYLLEMVRWSGRGDFRTAKQCPDCIARHAEAPGDPRLRCLECALPDLVCTSCCLRRHKLHPFHWIQVGNGVYNAYLFH